MTVAVLVHNDVRKDSRVRKGVRTLVENGVEVHLFGFEGNLYGTVLHVDFVSRLRDERKFDGVEALVEQLREDQKQAKRVLD